MALAGSLEVQMFAELARLRKDMHEAKGIVTSSAKGIESAVASAQRALGALGLGLSVVGFAAIIKGSIDAQDHLLDLSKTTRLSVEQLSGLSSAAKKSGSDLDGTAKAINKLAVEMGKDGEKFRALGITAKDPLKAFGQLADVMNAIQDPQKRAAVGAAALSKSWADAAPLMAEGGKAIAEMIKQGAALSKVTAESAKRADEFNDKWEDLKTIAGGWGTSIANPIVSGLLKIHNALGMEINNKPGSIAEFLFGPQRNYGYRGPLDKHGLPDISPQKAPDAPAGKPSKGAIDRFLGGDKGASARLKEAEIAAKAIVDIEEQSAKDITEAWKAWEDIEMANYKAITAASEAANSAVYEHTVKLSEQVVAAERALEIFGLTESQIAALDIVRLRHARTMAKENGAQAAALEYYEAEIDAIETIRTAKFAIEAKDTAKKEAEDAAKAWKDFTRDLESSLTDALMRSFESGESAGEAFIENLKNMIKTAALKFAVNLTVSTVGGAVQQATGLSFGGSGGSMGGAMNLLSTGQSLYGAFTGGTASTIGSMIGGSFGAGMQGASLAAGLAGPTTAGAAGAMGAGSMVASAIPYVAAAVAIASILGAFDKNKPAPIEWRAADYAKGTGPGAVWDQFTESGPFSNVVTLGQHLTRNGQSRAGLQSQITHPMVELDKQLAKLMDKAEIARVGAAFIGQGNSEGEHGWSQGGIEGVMMRRLDRISNAIGGWVDKLADTTTGTLQERYTQIAQILSIRGDAEMEKLANDMFNATGQWNYEQFNALQGSLQNFNSLFLSDVDQFDKYSEAMHTAFESLNIALPDSRDGFKSLVQGIDTSTASGFDLYATLLDLSPTMAAYYDALAAELDVKKQLVTLSEQNFATLTDFIRAKAYVENGVPLSMLSAANMPSYDVGTDFVPRTGPALIHRGERITTAADNASLSRGLESIARELAALKSSMQNTDRNTRKSADILVQVSRDGEALLTEAA